MIAVGRLRYDLEMQEFARRRQRALRAAAKAGVEALLVTHLPDVRYLCGFTGSAGALVLLRGAKPRFFTDGRYREQAAAEVQPVMVEVGQGAAALQAAAWAGKQGVSACGFDAAHTTVAGLEAMRAAVPAKLRRGLFRAATGVVAELRERKDAVELEVMRRASAMGCRLFEEVLPEVRAGVREGEIALWLESRARQLGAEAMSFETIVASGGRSALPHGRASRERLPRRGFLTLDFGVVVEGYCSDMTRTVHLGRPTAEARTVYDSVLEAQESALAMVRAGVSAGDVDEAARSVLQRTGLAQWFSHSTGHGVGLEIHEGPRIATKQTQLLETGMAVTIEPGVYLPGRFGVRIEDLAIVEKAGAEVLTPVTKALVEL